MASNNIPAQYTNTPESVPAPEVRVTPQHPLGGDMNKVDALQMAELGALIGAMGAEKGAMTSLLQSLQAATIQAWITHLPELLSKMREWERARFNRLMQAIQALPEAPIYQQGFLSRLTATVPPPQTNSYVDRAEVLRLVAVAMEESPVIR